MNSLKTIYNKLNQFPYITVFLCSIIYMLYYLKGMQIDYAMWGDMVGKWIQVQDLLTKPLFDHSCNYKETLDLDFKFIPLPEHFYFFSKKQCVHAYPYPYAYLSAPFVKISPKYGFYALNFIFWIGYIFFSMKLFEKLFPKFRDGLILIGLFSFLILPTGIYLFDYSELILTMCLSAYTYYLIVQSIELDTEKELNLNRKNLFLAGVLSGIGFSLRPEAMIFFGGVVFALWIDILISHKEKLDIKKIINLTFSGLEFSVYGLIVGFSITIAYHLIFFDTALPSRIGDPKSIPDATLKNKLVIILTLLIGGSKEMYSLGLFSSLPFTILSLAYLIPSIRAKIQRKSRFLFISAYLPSIIVILITPGHGGYSWSPRYLALMIFPISLIVFNVLFSGHSFLKNKIVQVLLVLLTLYSIYFTHTGMKIFQVSTKQIKEYNQIIDKISPNVIVGKGSVVYTMLSKDRLSKTKIYKIEKDEQFSELFEFIEKLNIDKFLFMVYEPKKVELTLPSSIQERWIVKKTDYFYNMNFVQIERVKK